MLDRMGTLPAAYASAHIALCGGTFAGHGGHNLIEPAAAGCAIVIGTHIAHIRGLVETLDAAGGVVRIPATLAPAAAITETLTQLHHDRARRRRLGDGASTWCAERRGAADLAAGRILSEVVD